MGFPGFGWFTVFRGLPHSATPCKQDESQAPGGPRRGFASRLATPSLCALRGAVARPGRGLVGVGCVRCVG